MPYAGRANTNMPQTKNRGLFRPRFLQALPTLRVIGDISSELVQCRNLGHLGALEYFYHFCGLNGFFLKQAVF
jgi:hypothetical protein